MRIASASKKLCGSVWARTIADGPDAPAVIDRRPHRPAPHKLAIAVELRRDLAKVLLHELHRLLQRMLNALATLFVVCLADGRSTAQATGAHARLQPSA
jgi:hypothetical protein